MTSARFFGSGEAGVAHLGAGRVGARLGQPLVQLGKGPGTLLGLQRVRVVVALHMPVRAADHAVEVRADAGLAALVEAVAGDAALRLGLRLAHRRVGGGEQVGNRRLRRRVGRPGGPGLRHLDRDMGFRGDLRMHQRMPDQPGAHKSDARQQHRRRGLVQFQAIHRAPPIRNSVSDMQLRREAILSTRGSARPPRISDQELGRAPVR